MSYCNDVKLQRGKKKSLWRFLCLKQYGISEIAWQTSWTDILVESYSIFTRRCVPLEIPESKLGGEIKIFAKIFIRCTRDDFPEKLLFMVTALVKVPWKIIVTVMAIETISRRNIPTIRYWERSSGEIITTVTRTTFLKNYHSSETTVIASLKIYHGGVGIIFPVRW